MSKKRYVVELSADERKRLEELTRKGKSPAKKQLKARILLQADESPLGPKWNDPTNFRSLGHISDDVRPGSTAIGGGGLDAVLNRKKRATPPVPRIFDGEKEARLIALACSQPPEGRANWTLRLLESKVVELNIVDHASDNTIGRVLKKMSSSLISNSNGSSRRKTKQRIRSGDGRYAGRLHTATRRRVSAGLSGRDVKATALPNTRAPIPMKPGQPARRDYEYERNGTANLFMMFAPLEGWRHVKVTDRRTAVDYAHALKDLADRHFPKAKKIVLVQDNLNTHKPASLYEAFPPAEARRLVERFEWHYSPKHGSWLDMAESELAVLSHPMSRPPHP